MKFACNLPTLPGWLVSQDVARIIGLGLLFATLIFSFSIIVPRLKTLERLQDSKAALLHRQAQASRVGQPYTQAQERLPIPDAPAVIVMSLHEVAARHDLNVEKATYEVLPGSSAPRFHARLLIRGTYVALRHFLSQALHEQPSVILERIRLERASSYAGELTAELDFAVVLENVQ